MSQFLEGGKSKMKIKSKSIRDNWEKVGSKSINPECLPCKINFLNHQPAAERSETCRVKK